jgi:branched-chain amino acid transport system substrate-binding protein
LAVAAAGALSAALALGSAVSAQSPSAGVPVATDPTPIGVLTPLSQPGDPGSGQLFGRGAALAKAWVDQRLDPSVWDASCDLPGPLNLITVDDQGTPEKGIAGLRMLALENHGAAVEGQIHSAVMLALGPIAESLQVPIMSATASNTDISNAHLAYTFQSHAITSDRAKAVADFISLNKDKFGKVAIVAENTDYGIGNVEDLKAALEGVEGVTLQDWVFDKESKDLSPLLLQVKSFDPDLIFNVSSGPTEYLMVEQAVDAQLLDTALMVISDDRPLRQEFWDAVGDAGKNIAFVTYFSPTQALTPAGEWFREQYQTLYGEPPVYTAYQGFGNTILLAQAVNKACSVSGPDLAAALEAGGFMSWNTSPVGFPQADGVDWHRLHIPVLLLQYTEAPQSFQDAPIIYPSDLATAEVVTPD